MTSNKPVLSLMVEVDPSTLAGFEKAFTVVKFSKAAADSKGEVLGEDDIAKHLAEVKPEVAVIELEPFTARVIQAGLPELKMIACSRATPTNIDVAECAKHGIAVSNAPGRNANAVVEMAIGFMICLARFIPQTHHRIMNRELTVPPGTELDHKDILWQNPALRFNPYLLYRGIEIEGRTLGLVGFGIIGKIMAPKAKGLGLNLLVYDPYVSAADMAKYGVEKAETLEQVLKNADFVSLHAKVTPETRHMIGAAQLAMMKPDAYLINTARGALLDQDALVQALRDKRIAGAALDVYDQEPQYDDSPLIGLDNIIMTPHIGGATKDVIRHHSRMLAENVAAYASGKELPNLVKAK